MNMPPETAEEEAVAGYIAIMGREGILVTAISPTTPGYADVIGDLFLRSVVRMPPGGWQMVDATRGKVRGPRGVWTMRLFWVVS